MTIREIIRILNKGIEITEKIRPRYLLININGVYFYVNKIDYDELHCRLYQDDKLIGGAFFHHIDSIEIY